MSKLISIEFGFSESGDPRVTEKSYPSWEAAEHALASVKGPDLGYYKTDFTITYDVRDLDDTSESAVYEGRYDIGSGSSLTGGLFGHVFRFAEHFANLPDHKLPYLKGEERKEMIETARYWLGIFMEEIKRELKEGKEKIA